ncbi:flagellar biosynthesis protein FlgL [Desulfovibrio sp. OttesenSCG-928-G15]|nr:flagellar biosynthesis protein FlgL [Desulfovibrio sp. OttesenSCG-928-G15]
MALRVTQGMMYSSFVGNMNMNLSAYMESNIQASSQKRVNRPSDDPVSAGRILSTRADLSKLGVYEENIEQAMGWLNLADTTLAGTDGSVQSILSTLKSLAEQAATGTYNESNREQIGMQARELFEQLITLSNTRFEGRHIFAGHKVDGLAYEQALGTSIKGEVPDDGSGITSQDIYVDPSGDLNATTIIRVKGPNANANADGEVTVAEAEFEYWDADKKEWVDATKSTVTNPDPTAPDSILIEAANGVKMTMLCNEKDRNGVVTVTKTVNIAEPREAENDHYQDNGTWFYVRPTAVYKGDDNYSEVSTAYAPTPAAAVRFDDSNLVINGNFSKDTIIRINKVENGVIDYSYSVNDGSTWIPATTPNKADPSFAVPGGTLTAKGAALTAADANTQMVIHPHRADINFQISEDDHITVNMVGANIFGGRYDYQGGSKDSKGDGRDYAVILDNPKPDENLFEVVGDLVGALETNDQQGCQEALEKLSSVMNVVLTRAAEVGGRENRLISQQANTVMRTYAEQDNLSSMEDIDITELMTKLAQQQIAYNSVLKSSSMIMQMSLVNFL